MNYQEVSDEELMLAYQGSDLKAFEILVTRHQKGIYNFIYRYLGESESSEEAFQEVFERVIRSAASFTPQARFSTWLYTIARNFCIDTLRKGKLRKTVSLEDPIGNDGEGIVREDRLFDENARPDRDVNTLNLTQKLVEALNNINPDQREVFLLREKQGLSFEEIAKIVGVSINTAKSRMRYALTALRDEFKKMGLTD